MSQPRPLVDRSLARRLLLWQLAAAAGVTLAALCFGRDAALAAGLGAGIALGGSTYFSWQAFRHAGAVEAQQIVRDFFRGGAGKLIITVLLFVAVFKLLPGVRVGWLFAGFILEQLLAWIVPLAHRTSQP